MTYGFMSKTVTRLMDIGSVLTWKLCPSIPMWKQYPPMDNNIEPLPTQNPWAWVWVWAPDVGLCYTLSVFLLLYLHVSKVCNNEHGVYGLSRIFTPLSTYDSVVFYAHSVDA
jgi:hypothetical protein